VRHLGVKPSNGILNFAENGHYSGLVDPAPADISDNEIEALDT
jgi:hypothetical protein